MGTLLWTVGVIVLITVLYLLYVLLQYALFNPIIAAVMLTIWFKMCKICNSMIAGILDTGRKKGFKKYIRYLKELEWLQKLNIEI